MPVTEDELDAVHSSLSQHSEYSSRLSKAEQRKNNKPIMEKRRRARINQCLNELKALILDATNKDPARHTKLEKADILEMTVKHLQSVQRQRFSTAAASDPTVIHKFKTGFSECASEVSKYIGSLEGIDDGVKNRLANHLSHCVSGIQPLPVTFNPFPSLVNPEDLNNNESTQLQLPRLQLIPSRLPSGELALLLPNSSTLSSLLPFVNQAHSSAFTPISKDGQLSAPDTIKCDSSYEVSSTSTETSNLRSSPTQKIVPRSSLLMPVTELNSDYKQNTFGLKDEKSSSVFKPLTVYTDPSQELLNSTRCTAIEAGKIPLDFSIKKEPSLESPTSTKISRKRPLMDLPSNIPPARKEIKLEMDDRFCESRSNEDHEEGDQGHDSMWRPW